MKQFTGVLRENREVALSTHEMIIESDLVKWPSLPGQFVHVAVPGGDLLLRRPISLYSVDKKAGVFSLIVQNRGEGTARLCALEPGAKLDLLGALGRGFTLPEGAGRAALVGGGIGVAPLLYCMQKWPQVSWDAFLGFRSAACAYGVDRFRALAAEVSLSCDDGSLGRRGFVTDALAAALEDRKYDIVMACGPTAMFRALKTVMAGYPDIPCLISLEQRMGCGVGVCRVCACKIREAGTDHYMRVCQDGPVFHIGKVVIE